MVLSRAGFLGLSSPPKLQDAIRCKAIVQVVSDKNVALWYAAKAYSVFTGARGETQNAFLYLMTSLAAAVTLSVPAQAYCCKTHPAICVAACGLA